MSEKINVSLLAYNEGHNLEKTIREGYRDLESLGYDYEMWLFDNCSTDNTQEIMTKLVAELPHLRYFRQPENLGYAFSTRSTLSEPEADIFVTVDGDGQYRLSDVKLLVDEVKAGNDIAFAVRAQRNDPFLRCLISGVFNIIARILLNSEVRDLNCGFRAMTSKTAKEIEIKYKRNFVGPEIYVRSKILDKKIVDKDVPHYAREGGVSVFMNFRSLSYHAYKMFEYIVMLRKELKASEKKTHTVKVL